MKINTKLYLVFRFLQIFRLTVIFAILIGHVEMKILTENASLQSHTMAYVDKHDMPRHHVESVLLGIKSEILSKRAKLKTIIKMI